MSAPSESDLLLREEVALMFKVEPSTVGRWGQSGRLVSVKTPGGWRRYIGAEVPALLAGETQEAARRIGLAEKARLTGRPG